MLARRELPSQDTMHRAMNAVGGLFIVPASADPQDVRTEVLARGIRALEVLSGASIEFVRGLPLEFLMVSDAGSVDPISTLQGLRGLHLGSWRGTVAFDALPLLEWFGTTEIERGQLEPLLENGGKRLHHLAAGRYRFADTAPLHSLTHLTHLAIGDSRALASLDGLDDLRRLQHLSLYICPKLESLSGVQAVVGLRHIEIESCNRITDLSPLCSLPQLCSVKIELRKPPTLAPLARHPSLEFLWVVSTKVPAADQVEQLLESPRLRFLAAGRRCWLREDSEWQHVPNIYDMAHRQSLLHDRLINQWNAVAAW